MHFYSGQPMRFLSGVDNFALFSCFVNGEPAAAIVAVNRDGDGYAITPLSVTVTPSLTLTDHDGQPASKAPP